MDEFNVEAELLEMREQLRNIKQQVDIHTTYHEDNLRKSIQRKTTFFKGMRIMGYVSAVLWSVMLIACISWICMARTWDAWIIVLLFINFAILAACVWGMRFQDRKFQLHRLNELDLLTAQTKVEEYKAYTKRLRRITQPIAIVLMAGLCTYYYITDPSALLRQIPPILIAIIIVLPLSLLSKKNLRSISTDIAELRAMEER